MPSHRWTINIPWNTGMSQSASTAAGRRPWRNTKRYGAADYISAGNAAGFLGSVKRRVNALAHLAHFTRNTSSRSANHAPSRVGLETVLGHSIAGSCQVYREWTSLLPRGLLTGERGAPCRRRKTNTAVTATVTATSASTSSEQVPKVT